MISATKLPDFKECLSVVVCRVTSGMGGTSGKSRILGSGGSP